MTTQDAIALTVDGEPTAVGAGATVLDAVLAAGVELPHLCKDDDGPALGACRTCLVEVDGVRGLPASCSLPAAEGMVVRTASDEARRARRGVLELTLGMRDAAADPLPGSDLGRVAVAHAADARRWPPRLNTTRDDSNPFYLFAAAECILCGRLHLWPARTCSTSAPSASPAAARRPASPPSTTSRWPSRSAPPAASASRPAPPARSDPSSRPRPRAPSRPSARTAAWCCGIKLSAGRPGPHHPRRRRPREPLLDRVALRQGALRRLLRRSPGPSDHSPRTPRRATPARLLGRGARPRLRTSSPSTAVASARSPAPRPRTRTTT